MSRDPWSDDRNASPVNPIPPVTVALCLLIVGVEAIFSLGAAGVAGGPGAVGWRLAGLERYAFSGEILEWMRRSGQYPPEHLLRFLSYPFVHASFTSALIAAVMLLALGKMVAEALGPLRLLAIFSGSTVGAALVYGLILPGGPPLFGAFPPVYGLIGAFTYLLWIRLGALGEQQIRAFSLIGVLMGLQLVFGLLFGGGPYWIAELVGFALGFGLAVLLVPGGVTRLIARLRRR